MPAALLYIFWPQAVGQKTHVMLLCFVCLSLCFMSETTFCQWHLVGLSIKCLS